MSSYYLDFVGLNTFIYDIIGYDEGLSEKKRSKDTENQTSYDLTLNHFGFASPDIENISPTVAERGQIGTTYKNFRFPFALANTASYFPALMIHRNGPYGWPTWKQTRIGQNPLTKRQRENNIFTYVVEPGPTLEIQGNKVVTRHGVIKKFSETPIVGRFKPVLIRGAASVISEQSGRTILERFDIKSSFGNSLCHFNNTELNKYYNFMDEADDVYDEIKQLYLEGGLDAPDSPMDVFEFVRYSETVYPKQVYTNKHHTRQRTTFSFDWNDDREHRHIFGKDPFLNVIHYSIWPLDASRDWATTFKRWADRGLASMDVRENDYGLLQNDYTFADPDMAARVLADTLDAGLAQGPVYSRKHDTTPSSSVVGPSGMIIHGINSGSSMGDIDPTSTNVSGEAKWEAGIQSGKTPFYNSYDEYVQGVRQKGKGYTIIPEFRISNHIDDLVVEGLDATLSNLFELHGGLTDTTGSNGEDFYKIYSTSEFLKHFDLVKEDHKDFVEPTRIKLKCKAIKKFLPYNGFYPCQRSLEVAQQFYLSYKDHVSVASGSSFDYTPIDNASKVSFQNLYAPIAAPGLLFNAIKSGIAVDYPIHTSSIAVVTGAFETSANYYLTNTNYLTAPTTTYTTWAKPIFDKRVPFNALVEPERYLAGETIRCSEPHQNVNHSSSVLWSGEGDNYYKMMMHNFLAEVPNFFLQDQDFTSISSLPSNHPKVGNATEGTKYTMRVKLYKSFSGSSPGNASGSTTIMNYYPPQQNETSGTFENFTMYSRPSAFGPPSQRIQGMDTSAFSFTSSNSAIGENYPFTPPYYDGQAWADIEFTAGSTKKYTIDEIIRESYVTYWRYIDNGFSRAHPADLTSKWNLKTKAWNDDSMQISASLNLFAQGEIKSVDLLDDSTSDKVNVAVDVSSDKKSRWFIQPYFETPMLNFNDYGDQTSLTLPTYGSQSVPRGMWHQYGRIEADPAKGIFMQVTDIPKPFINRITGSLLDKSLKDLCGFKSDPRRLGQIAESKIVSEAVVAIPFIEKDNQRQFFKINREVINSAVLELSMLEENIGDSIEHMVKMMKKFVIPPNFDFVHRADIDPFAMYIFEFNHKFSQQDLSDIWQNLSPDSSQSFDEATATIMHPLLASELLGGGEFIRNNQKKKGNHLPDNIQWLVFKAKQRAETNYYNKVVGEMESTLGGTGGGQASKDFTTRRLAKQAASMLRPESYLTDLSYNWPYDFFSLVELVKIDAELTLSDPESILRNDDKIVAKRGLRGLAGLPPRAQSRIEEGAEEEDNEQQINIPRPGGFFR